MSNPKGSALEINCPYNPLEIKRVLLNGEDCGGVQGITRISFEVLPGKTPKLLIERGAFSRQVMEVPVGD